MTPKVNTGRQLDVLAPSLRFQSGQMGTLTLGHPTFARIWSTMGNPPIVVPLQRSVVRRWVPVGGCTRGTRLLLPRVATVRLPVTILPMPLSSWSKRGRPMGRKGDTPGWPYHPRPLAGSGRNLGVPRLPESTSPERNKMQCETGLRLFQASYVRGSTRAKSQSAPTQAYKA